MDFLPIFMNIQQQSCLVVGGGSVAARKVALLLQAGARVSVVSPKLCDSLKELHELGHITYYLEVFTPSHLDQQTLVIAPTDNEWVNRQVSEQCQARALPINVVDQPELCRFIMPSIIDRSPVLIAVSTGGSSPVLARLLRGRLESLIPAAYGRLAALAATLRKKVQQTIPANQRRTFWEGVLQGPIAELVLSGQEAAARSALESLLTQASKSNPGEIYLVDGNPGDPDLLTFRALRLMQQADLVLYDQLTAPTVLELTRRDAERMAINRTNTPQSLVQELALQDQRVLLLIGDPLMYNQCREELQTLARSGLSIQIVPGIPS